NDPGISWMFANLCRLLREAVVRFSRVRPARIDGAERVADVLLDFASTLDTPLSLDEAVRLEAHVTARRQPAVAAAIEEAVAGWRAALDPLIDLAFADGTFAPDIDPDAVAYFMRTVGLGLLLQRASGAKTPD
ncbi:MAG TPA: hypothetical protein PLV68_12540, partial [Ilumatobacteraceae bacterium]|nr:hypothetical protein [Ilumatobacteraceae bacterium]